MSTPQVITVITKTRTRELTDEVRMSPVDEYLGRLHVRLFWALLIGALILAFIL